VGSRELHSAMASVALPPRKPAATQEVPQRAPTARSMDSRYDLVVIGGGSGGLACSKEAAKPGQSLVELSGAQERALILGALIPEVQLHSARVHASLIDVTSRAEGATKDPSLSVQQVCSLSPVLRMCPSPCHSPCAAEACLGTVKADPAGHPVGPWRCVPACASSLLLSLPEPEPFLASLACHSILLTLSPHVSPPQLTPLTPSPLLPALRCPPGTCVNVGCIPREAHAPGVPAGGGLLGRARLRVVHP